MEGASETTACSKMCACVPLGAGQWFCPCCVREGRAPGPAPNEARFAAPHPAVAADDFHRCALQLRAKDWPECAPCPVHTGHVWRAETRVVGLNELTIGWIECITPHPAVTADDSHRCAQQLRAKDWPECAPCHYGNSLHMARYGLGSCCLLRRFWRMPCQ